MDFQNHIFPHDEIRYITPSWADLDKLTFILAQKILAQKIKLDRIVTLAKGGWPMTRSLVDYLEINEVASIGVKFYSGIGETFDKPQIYQDLPISVKGESVLLFDDVADTGHSLAFAREHLEKEGVANITTCTLFFKPRSKVKPDFFASKTNDWIIFPYDQVEAIRVLGDKWEKQAISHTQIKSRLRAFGISNEVIKSYYDKINTTPINKRT